MKKVLTVTTLLLTLVVIVACGTTKYTVTFDSNGGSEVPSLRVNANEILPEPTSPELAGYTFDRWYKDEEFSSYWDFETDLVTEDITLYANWLGEQLTVSFQTDGGTNIDNQLVHENDLVPVPVRPTKEGYDFVGWYTNDAFTIGWNFNTDRIITATTLYARWREVKVDYTESFKILSIGNSFSEDAHRYLVAIAQSWGIPAENIIVANMYIGGAELVRHVTNLASDSAVYSYQRFVGTQLTSVGNYRLNQAIIAEDWDVVTFQQASHHSGVADTYQDYVERLSRWAKQTTFNDDLVIGWHQTWAYEQTSTHSGFANYDRNQETMYHMILDAYVDEVQPLEDLEILIPSGTAVQNARTSYLGDRLTRDGYHLSDPLGRYIAGLTFFKAITGFEVSIDTITYAPAGVTEEDQLMAFEAVNHAYNNPYQVTDSTFNDVPDEEPIEIEGVSLPFDYVQGFWNSNATAVSPETDALHYNFVAVMPIHKSLLPVGSEIVIEADYQYRTIFLSREGDGYRVLHRTDNTQLNYYLVDETFWGEYEYVAFNISTVPTRNIAAELDDVAAKFKLYHPEGTQQGHMDEPLSFELGVWEVGQSELIESNITVSSNVLSQAYFETDVSVEVSSGYEFAIATLTFQDGSYEVLAVSEFNVSLTLTEAFWEGKDLIAFIVRSTTQADLSGDLDVLTTLTLTSPEIPHIDSELSFVSGYWADNATEILFDGTPFASGFAASNVFSKPYFLDIESITVEAGYQVRLIFLSYDLRGNYRVIRRTANLTDTIVLDEHWGDDTYLAINISENPSTDLTEQLESLVDKLTFDPKERLLNFVSGFWGDNTTSITPGNTEFNRNFIASAPVEKSLLPVGTIIKVPQGYEMRVILLSYDEVAETLRVRSRTANFSGDVLLTSAIYKEFDYIAFNITATPARDLSENPNLIGDLLDFDEFDDTVVEHEDQPISFELGYWDNNATAPTTTGSLSVQFIASNVLSKAYFSDVTSLTVEAGYQVRIIFLDYEFNTYTVLTRTNNLTETVLMNEAFWGDYTYIAFNISTSPTTDISQNIEAVSQQIIFQ